MKPSTSHKTKAGFAKLHRRGCAIAQEILVLAFLSVLGVPNTPAQITRNITDGTTPPGIAPGAPAGSYALSDFDNISLYSGKLNFRLPLRQISGRGEAGYAMTLQIEHPWTIDSSTDSDGRAIYWPTSAWWSSLDVGYGPGVMEGRNAIEQEFCPPGSISAIIVTRTLLRLTFTAPDGTEYELRDKLTDGAPATISGWNCSGGFPPPGFDRGREFVSRDGTTVTFLSDPSLPSLRDDLSGDSIRPTGNLMFRNGTRYRIEGGLVVSIRDRNGNLTTFEYDIYRRVTKITDSLRRITDIAYASPGNVLNPDIISFQGFGETLQERLREIRIWRKYLLGSPPMDPTNNILRPDYVPSEFPKTLNTMFPELVTPDNTHHNAFLVSAVQLPDGRQYQFLYNNFGELARVTLPTGGAIEYDWGTSTNVASGSWGSAMVYRRVKQRRVYADGANPNPEKRTYFDAPVLTGGSAPQIVTVSYKNAAENLLAMDRHSFYGNPVDAISLNPVAYSWWNEGREHQTEYLDVNGATVLKRENHAWQQRVSGGNPTDPRIWESVTTLDPDQPPPYSKTGTQTFFYSPDAFNNKTDTFEYDYGAASWIRHTQTQYVTSTTYTDANIHLRSLPREESVFDVSGEQSRITYDYDNYAVGSELYKPLVPRAGANPISQLDPTFTNTNHITRGNVTRTGHWLNTNNSTIYDYQQYDVAGNVVKAIDARGAIANPVYGTSFFYIDFFGTPNGETHSNTVPMELGTQTTFAFPTQITNALGYTSYTQYDYYLGKPVDTEDPNGIVDSISYSDVLDRPSQVIRANNLCTPPNYPYPCSQTTFAYNDVTRLVTTTSDLNSYQDTTNPLTTELVYDGLGRTIETRLYEGASYIKTEQNYDAMGPAGIESLPAVRGPARSRLLDNHRL